MTRISKQKQTMTDEVKKRISNSLKKYHKKNPQAAKNISKLLRGSVGRNKGCHWKVKDTSNMNKDKIGKKRKNVDWLKGENNYGWIKDRSKLAVLLNGEEYRNSPMSREWALLVKKRDKWSCKIKNKNCDRRIVAHHILSWAMFPKLRYEVNNGITLCHFHHPRKRNDEMRLTPYFQNIVKVNAK